MTATNMRWIFIILGAMGLMLAPARAESKHDKKLHNQANTENSENSSHGGKPSHGGKSNHPGKSDDEGGVSGEATASDSFSDTERRMICDYFKVAACGSANTLDTRKGKPKDAIGSKQKTAMPPPGLDGRSELPPGLERQYQRKGKLPPGLQKRMMPDDLARTLPRRMDGVERIIAGNDVLLVQTATGIVLDIMEGVAARQ